MLSGQLKESQSELETLIKIFAKMPGLGPRSAQRLVFHLIKKREIMLDQLISSLENINSKIIVKINVDFLIKNYRTSLLPVWLALLTTPLFSI